MTIIEKHRNGILYYQFEKFVDINNINHLFTSKVGWDNDSFKANISDIFQIPEKNIISLKQIHSTNIEIIDKKLENYYEISKLEADGLITDLTGIVLTTYHADCVPIYFYDIKNRIVGIAHGGWRGTFNDISGKMIDMMITRYNSNSKDILVGIGPSIGPCCYEIGKELADEFSEKYNKFPHIVIKRDGKFFLDLWRLNYYQVEEKGVHSGNIISSNTCTSCQVENFHSYRREKGTKNRMIAAIGLTENPRD